MTHDEIIETRVAALERAVAHLATASTKTIEALEPLPDMAARIEQLAITVEDAIRRLSDAKNNGLVVPRLAIVGEKGVVAALYPLNGEGRLTLYSASGSSITIKPPPGGEEDH